MLNDQAAKLFEIEPERDIPHVDFNETNTNTQGLAEQNEYFQDHIHDYNLTDAGNAEVIGKLYHDKIRFDHRSGKWFIFDGQIWQQDQAEEIKRLALDAMRTRLNSSSFINDQAKRQAVAKWALYSENNHKLESALKFARSLDPIRTTPEKFDKDHFKIGCPNGIIDLQTGELLEASPAYMISKSVNATYDIDATCPKWENFLDEIFDGDTDLINFIQLAAGYSLTGSVDEQVIFILWGMGANGKSTFLNVLSYLLNDYAANTPFSTLESAFNDSGRIPNDLAALPGKRLVTASEVKERSYLNEARVKSLSGGDPITARFLHQEFFTFSPTFKLWLAVNHKPKVSDNSLGFWRRIRLIPFTRQFTGKDADKDLQKKLEAEASGILNWLIAGCLAWRQAGLTNPGRIESETETYRSESDVFSQFLEECTLKKESAEIESMVLYSCFKSWADHSGEKTISKNLFGRKMGEYGFEKTKDHTTRRVMYKGIELIQ